MPIWEKEFPQNDTLRRAIRAAETCTKEKANELYVIAGNVSSTVDKYRFVRKEVNDVVWSVSSACFVVWSYFERTTVEKRYFSYALDALQSAVNAGQNWKWVNDLYHSIHKKKNFPQKWKTPNTVNVAKCILEHKIFSDMPILADALEDAGCTDVRILKHLRERKDMWCPADWVLVNLVKNN